MQPSLCDAFSKASSKAQQGVNPGCIGSSYDGHRSGQENQAHTLFTNAPRPTYPVFGIQPQLLCDSQSRTFRPMQTKLGGFELLPIPSNQSQSLVHSGNDAYRKMLAGFSPNYQGNIHLARNRSANIPAHQNCALFIVGLPPQATITDVLATVRNAGRVYATHLNAPEPDRGHLTSAAKIIFFERQGAERFYNQHAPSGLRIPGYPDFSARVVWNRIRTAASDSPRHYSRVLVIAGPACFVNPFRLTTYFQSKIEFDIDEIVDRGGNADRRLVEYRFGSFRCQAEAAKMAITRELTELGVQVWFGRDPCDVPVGADQPLPSA